MEKTGRVVKKLVAQGTKSERPAIVLVAPEGEYILRRSQGNPFVDDVLESLVGQNVTVQGSLLAGSTFEAREITPLAASAE